MGVFHEYEVLLKFDLWILMTVSCAISCYIVPRNIESLWYLLENASVQLFKLLTHSSLPWLMTIEAWRRLCPRSTSLVIIVMGLVSYVSAPWTKTVMTLRIMIQINMSTSWQKGVRFTSHIYVVVNFDKLLNTLFASSVIRHNRYEVLLSWQFRMYLNSPN